MDPAFFASSCRKRPLLSETNFTKCIICQVDAGGNVHKLTENGIKALRDALAKRQDDVYDRLHKVVADAVELLSKSPFCHKSCKFEYMYTDKMQHRGRAPKHPKLDTEQRAKRTGFDYRKVCIICDKVRDTKGMRKMSLVSSDERQDSIYEKAKELNDESVLRKITGHGDECIDMKTHGFRYHRPCMTSFMCRNGSTEDVESTCMSKYDQCFETLVAEISNGMEKQSAVYYMSQLRDRYRQLLADNSVSDAPSYINDNMEIRLRNHFGCRIQIIPQKGSKSSLVASSKLSAQDMCYEIARLKGSIEESQLHSETDTGACDDPLPDDIYSIEHSSFVTAKCLRRKLKDKANELRTTQRQQTSVDGDDAGQPSCLDVSYAAASAIVPDDLYNHLAWMITDADFPIERGCRVNLSDKMHEKVVNLPQDVMAATAPIPLPKHVGLGLHVLKQTRSKELLTVMNRFGNSIGYNDAQRYLTTEENDVAMQEQKSGIYIPTNLKVGSFTHCAFDNLDFSESTPDGTTLHATTHNIYQYMENGTDTCSVSTSTVPLPKGRDVAVRNATPFVPPETVLTLKDRREARNLEGVPLVNETDTDDPSFHLQDDTMVWRLARMLPTTLMAPENVPSSTSAPPSWNEYFERIHDKSHKTTIAYGSLFPSSPTNPSVVEASLDYFVDITKKMEQEHTVVTCDQAIYDIAKGLQRKKRDKYSDLVLRMGGFHIAENFMGAIGFLMKGSGLDDILTLSKLCGQGTANKIMNGKDYYKMIRYHSLLSDAIMRLKWNAFEDFLVEEALTDNMSVLSDKLEGVLGSFTEGDEEDTRVKVDDAKTEIGLLKNSWQEFECTLGPTGQFWSMYLDMIAILHRYVRSERCSSWTDNLAEVQNMIPYIVSAGHTKYSTCLPMYLHDMKTLAVTAPDVHRQFNLGHFSVHRKDGAFNGIWTDMALEQTYNKDGKSMLLKGISQAASTREKYLKTIPFLTAVSENVKDMCHIAKEESSHHGESTAMNADTETQVTNIIDTIRTHMIDPFTSENKDNLVNIATGETARSVDILLARSKGIEAMKDAEVHGYTQIVQPKLVSFGSQTKKKSKPLTAIFRDEINVTRSLCFVRESSEEAKRQCFSHEWTDYPASIFEPHLRLPQGYAMRKGNKHDFLKVLTATAESKDSNVPSLPDSALTTVYIIDAMAFIQRNQKYGAKKFGELPDFYLKKILSMAPTGCKCVHFIGDRYDVPDDKSLKSDERLRRRQSKASHEYKPSDNVDIPDWKLFLNNSANKENLLHYLATSWCANANELPDAFVLILGGTFRENWKSVKLSNGGVTQLPELSCLEHEEADTRIVAHVAYSLKQLGHKRAVVYATDTDVTLICMYHTTVLHNLNELWVETKEAYIPVHTMVEDIASTCQKPVKSTAATLLACYVLSGCDTVSFPYRRGKRQAAKITISLIGLLPELEKYGEPGHGLEITDSIMNESRTFFAALYGRREFKSLDVLRAHLFVPSKADIRSLPPTEDAFRFHVQRALYQLIIYKRAHLSELSLPNLDLFGRTVVNGKLIPVMMVKPSRPSVHTATYCKCKTSKCLKSCSCAKALVPCVVACRCTGVSDMCARIQ